MLKFREKNGIWSPCILEDKIIRFLSAAHEDHGHFGADLCLNYLIGRAYWPTRVKDVYAWCRSCHSCQAKMKKPIKARIRSIQVFGPMKMLGMDWVGPITPACSITGVMYVLLVVDYFTRFVWAKGYLKHTADEVIDIYENHISPIFGHSEAVYSDNGSYFVNQKVQDYFQERGVTHFTGPVSHPSSTGLLERAVQSMMSYLRGRCIERASTEGWSMDIREGVVFANTKSQKIHGYAPAELILGFSSQMKHFDVEWEPPTEADLEIKDTAEHQKQIYRPCWGVV